MEPIDLNSDPNSLQIEKELIACLLDEPSYISYAYGRLTANDFTNALLRICYKQIIDLYNANEKIINLQTIKERISATDYGIDADDVDDMFMELGFNLKVNTLDEFKKLVDIKKCQSINESLNQFGTDLSTMQINTGDIEDKLNQLNSQFFFITSSWVTSIEGKNAHNLLVKFTQDVNNQTDEEVNNKVDQFASQKYKWCMHCVDELLDGFNNELLYILAARPGVGKTTLALNWAVAFSKMALAKNKLLKPNEKKHVVLFFSLEMSADQMFDKTISLVSFFDNFKIKKRMLSGYEKAKLHAILQNENMDELPILFYDEGDLTLSKLESVVKENTFKYVVDLVVIDYLQLVKVNSDKMRFNTSRATEVGIISKTLKTMALTLHIPIIALSQLSRRVEQNKMDNTNKKPLLSDLRESGAIEQDADVVMFLYNGDNAKQGLNAEPNKETFLINFAVEKNRFGSCGERQLEFAKYCSRFNDVNNSDQGQANPD